MGVMSPIEMHPLQKHFPGSWRKVLIWCGAIAAVLFTLIGAAASPHDELGQPVLLTRAVRAVTQYRREILDWTAEMDLLDGRIALVLDGTDPADLFAQSRSAQTALEKAAALVSAVDQAEVPPAGAGVHAEISAAALAYLEAARDALMWVSAPGEDSRGQALQQLEQARLLRAALRENAWLSGK